jgi:small neutral amino acid transporter SnatA (MarC family)
MSEFISAVVLIILVTDPFGNVPLAVGVLQHVAPERRLKVILRECLIAYVILLFFMFGGKSFLDLMRLSEISLSIAGGVILFLIALRMVFPSDEGVFGGGAGGEPLIVPLAIPAIAGPSALATVMLMVSREPHRLWVWIGAVTCAMLLATLVLASAERIQRIVGERGLRAFERLMGLVLTAMAVEMLLGGIREFVRHLGNA